MIKSDWVNFYKGVLTTELGMTAQKWQQISEDFMERMGFNEYVPYVAVQHNDLEHDHIHIVAS